MSSAERALKVREQIHDACLQADRNPATVQLIAVSKTFPLEALRPVYDAGQRDFGENYAQELDEKAQTFAKQGCNDIVWHYIGRIQSNKIKYIAAHATYVHAVEKVSHAQALGAKAPGPIKILVSVNIGREESKGGLMPEDVIETCMQMHEVENVEVCGLMCLPPRSQDPEDSAPLFAKMAALAHEGRSRGVPLTELSMGMSNDFQVAIRYGATWVRVGSAIFGPRG